MGVAGLGLFDVRLAVRVGLNNLRLSFLLNNRNFPDLDVALALGVIGTLLHRLFAGIGLRSAAVISRIPVALPLSGGCGGIGITDTEIVLGELEIPLGGDTVSRQRGVTSESEVLLKNLLRRSAHLDLGTVTFVMAARVVVSLITAA